MYAMCVRTNLKQTAELYRWAVSHSLIEPQEVWRWCEQVAATHPNPPLFLVEAVGLKPEGVRALRVVLSQMPGVCDMAQVARWAFGLQFVCLSESPDRLQKVVWRFTDDIFEAQVIGELARAEIVRFQERWGAIQIGVITQQSVDADIRQLTADVLDFLQRESRFDFKACGHLKAELPQKSGKEERAGPDASQFGAKSLLFWAELIMETSPPMPVESLNLKETALFYAEALHSGLVDVEDVLAWCGSVSAPAAVALQRALAKGKDAPDVLEALWQVEGESDHQAVLRRLFGLMYERLKQDDTRFVRIMNGLEDLRFEDDENFSLSEAVKDEIRYFIYRCDVLDLHPTQIPYGEGTQLVAELLDFLQKASRGETTEYARQEYGWEYYPAVVTKSMRKKIPGLIFEALIVGLLTSIAIMLMRSQEQAGSGIGWGEFILVLIIVALYAGINRWRRKR